jgi:hypothetical protein
MKWQILGCLQKVCWQKKVCICTEIVFLNRFHAACSWVTLVTATCLLASCSKHNFIECDKTEYEKPRLTALTFLTSLMLYRYGSSCSSAFTQTSIQSFPWASQCILVLYSIFRRSLLRTSVESPSVGAFPKLRRTTISFAMSLRLYGWKNSAPTARISMKFEIWVFFENMSRKFNFH